MGSPLELSDVSCVPGVAEDCAWDYFVTDLPLGQSGLNAIYSSGQYANVDSDIAALSAPDTVIASLDIQPANGVYVVAANQVSQQIHSEAFNLSEAAIPPSQLQSVVTQNAAKSRVITALAFDALGQLHLLSYGWQGDTTTVYETNVMTVTAENVADASTSLASEGYVITAFGGDFTHGFVLVGTKVQGDTLPRSILVATQGSAPFAPGATNGYATVGWVQYGSDGYAVIYEK